MAPNSLVTLFSDSLHPGWKISLLLLSEVSLSLVRQHCLLSIGHPNFVSHHAGNGG
jgi:hypothetical protein